MAGKSGFGTPSGRLFFVPKYRDTSMTKLQVFDIQGISLNLSLLFAAFSRRKPGAASDE